MLTGATVLVLDAAALLTYKFFDSRYWESSSNESIFELPVLLIGLGLLGALLGLIGAAGATALGDLLDRWQKPTPALVSLFADQLAQGEGGAAVKTRVGGAGKVIPGRLLRVASGLTWGAAVMVVFGVIPALAASNIARTAPRAVPAFAANAILNVLIGIALLVPLSRRNTAGGKVLVVVAGFLSLLLGFALLDAASALAAHGAARLVAALACLAGAAGDLGAGILALVAALRRPGFADALSGGVGSRG
jgi:hypothetical protein